MTAFIPHLAALRPCSCLPVSHNSLLVREWCPPVSAGLSAALVCLLFVAGDRGTDGALRFPLQRVSATKCSIMQDGFLLQKQLPQWISYTLCTLSAQINATISCSMHRVPISSPYLAAYSSIPTCSFKRFILV